MFRPDKTRRQSLAQEGGATIELQTLNGKTTVQQQHDASSLDMIATQHSIHEVAIDIVPEGESKVDTSDTGGGPKRTKSLSSLKSFSFKSKGKEVMSSAHLFHSERDETKLISKTFKR